MPRPWNSMARAGFLVWLTWATIVIPRLLQSLTAPKHRTTTRSESEGYSAIAGLADRALTALLIGFCCVMLLHLAKRGRLRPSRTLLVFLVPWVVLVVRDLYAGSPPRTTSFLYPLLGLTIACLRPRMSELRHLGYAIGVTALVSIVLGFLLPEAGIYRAVGGELIAPDKQILPWGILVGPFTSGNNLAQFLVLGLPAALLITRMPVRLFIIALVAFAMIWTSSRSALIALGVCLVVALTLRIPGRLVRGGVAAIAMAATGATAVLLPVVTTDPLAFTNRGYIWDASLRMWSDSPWFGKGSGWYGVISKYQTELGGSAFHAHNEAVQSLVTGGIIFAMALVLIAVVAIVRASGDAAAGVQTAAVFVSVLFVTCWFEVSFAFVDRLLLVPVVVVPLAFVFFRDSALPRTELTRRPG